MKISHLLHKGKRAIQRRKEHKGGDCKIRKSWGWDRIR